MIGLIASPVIFLAMRSTATHCKLLLRLGIASVFVERGSHGVVVLMLAAGAVNDCVVAAGPIPLLHVLDASWEKRGSELRPLKLSSYL